MKLGVGFFEIGDGQPEIALGCRDGTVAKQVLKWLRLTTTVSGAGPLSSASKRARIPLELHKRVSGFERA